LTHFLLPERHPTKPAHFYTETAHVTVTQCSLYVCLGRPYALGIVFSGWWDAANVSQTAHIE
jgi:hypothetical protein